MFADAGPRAFPSASQPSIQRMAREFERAIPGFIRTRVQRAPNVLPTFFPKLHEAYSKGLAQQSSVEVLGQNAGDSVVGKIDHIFQDRGFGYVTIRSVPSQRAHFNRGYLSEHTVFDSLNVGDEVEFRLNVLNKNESSRMLPVAYNLRKTPESIG